MKPSFMHVTTLPWSLRQQYRAQYQQLIQELEHVNIDRDYNTSDPNAVLHSIKEQAQVALSLLNMPEPEDHAQRLQQLIAHCQQWDNVGDLRFEDFYPELIT
jgi:hypothetical protein